MKKYFKRFYVAAIACAVAVSSLPGMTIFAEETNDNASALKADWSSDIDSMLEGRDFVEGQVLAVFDNSVSESDALSTLSDDEESENLGVLSDEAVEETIDADVKNSDEAACVRVITSDDKSTKDLLTELASNPAVIYAEPDYISATENLDETEYTEEDETATAEVVNTAADESNASDTAEHKVKKEIPSRNTVDLIEDQGYEAVSDLSYLQWAYTDEETSLYSIHSPNWNATYETNTGDETPVAAVIDSGIDYNHPEFDGIIEDLSQYSKLAGKYGYNCTVEGDSTDPMDDNGHGTHCAGIIAAKWDGTGTSGVASGAHLAIVRASVDGVFHDSTTVRGFMLLKEAVEKGLNLKSINCSFGGDAVGNIVLMMVNELGEVGAITCFASGNSTNDNDDMPNTSGEMSASPYLLNVDAANTSGEITYYSCYGQTTTDLASPGNVILAPVSNQKSSYMASIDKNRVTYDGFTGSDSESGVKISYLGTYNIKDQDSIDFDSEEEFIKLVEDAKETGKVISDENSFDKDGSSYEVTVPALTSKDERACFLVAVPIDEANIKNISKFSMALKSTLNEVNVWARYFEFDDAEGESYSGKADISTSSGWIAASNVWSNMPITLQAGEQEDTAHPYYNGCLYFIAEVQDIAATGAASKLYIDSVGTGYSTLRYAYLEGTSMATPAITGSVAVLYSELESEGKLDGLTPAEKAAYVTELMMAKTEPRETLKDKCQSNGTFDFDITEEAYTPVITSFEDTDKGIVIINGNFFGTEVGTVKIDGKECEIQSWNDVNVVAKLPDGQENGRFALDLTKANGKTATRKVTIDTIKKSSEQAFEGKIELPEEIAGCQLRLTALDGTLYAFPQTITENYDNTAIWNTLWSYDSETEEWNQCADIPASKEAISGVDNFYNIEVSSYQDFVIAEVEYAIKPDGFDTVYGNEFFIYYPETDTWTKLDLSGLDLPESGTIGGCDAGLFYFGGKIEGTKRNDVIYKLNFSTKQVKKGAESVKVTKVTKAGTYDASDFGYSTISSYGNEILFGGMDTSWLKWSETDQKFNVKTQRIDDLIGQQHDKVCFIAAFAETLTPSGAVVSALNGNDYTNRGYDTFYFSEDGTRTNFGKFASFGDLYNPSSCYSEGTLYVWGDTYYGNDKTEGYLTYTKVNMPRIESSVIGNKCVTISWRPLDYQGDVRVFYKVGNSSTWKVAGDPEGTSLKITGLKNGKKYTFTLRAVDEAGVDYISGYDKIGTSIIYLTKPVIIKAVSTKTGRATINWSKNSKADGYQIIYKTGTTKNKVTIKNNSTVKKVLKNLEKGKTYKIYVRSYKKDNGKTYYSRVSTVKKVKIK